MNLFFKPKLWWLRQKRRQRMRFVVWGAVALYGLVIGVFVACVLLPPYIQSLKQVTIQYYREPTQAPASSDRRWLDGITMATSTVNVPLAVVVIENHVDARPLAGIAAARVVYEVPVEGNITRFLAFFPLPDMPERIGPVRSARSYMLKLLGEWGLPLFMHVGGSPDAIATLKRGGYNDFDEYFNGQYFWRDEKRERPHNVFTSGGLAGASQRATTTVFSQWLFENTIPSSTTLLQPEGVTLNVVYSRPWHTVMWVYDADDGVYYRLQADKLHRAEDGKKIGASTVVVQRVYGEVVDDIGRLEMSLQGEGEAFVFKHGERATSTWKRSVGEIRTRFYDAHGKEILFAPGVIWLEIVMPWHDVW